MRGIFLCKVLSGALDTRVAGAKSFLASKGDQTSHTMLILLASTDRNLTGRVEPGRARSGRVQNLKCHVAGRNVMLCARGCASLKCTYDEMYYYYTQISCTMYVVPSTYSEDLAMVP